MRTQEYAHGGSHGKLWELMTGMEFILEHLEEWKALYNNPATELAAELASQQPIEPFSPGPTPDLALQPSTPTIQARDRPTRQSRLPQHLQGFKVITPSRQQQWRHQQLANTVITAADRFNEDALPDHDCWTYKAQSISRISSLAVDERAYMRA